MKTSHFDEENLGRIVLIRRNLVIVRSSSINEQDRSVSTVGTSGLRLGLTLLSDFSRLSRRSKLIVNQCMKEFNLSWLIIMERSHTSENQDQPITVIIWRSYRFMKMKSRRDYWRDFDNCGGFLFRSK